MIGEELKRYRLNAFITQKHLGELLGFHGRTAERIIQRWEHGDINIPLKHFRKLHELIGIPYEKMVP